MLSWIQWFGVKTLASHATAVRRLLFSINTADVVQSVDGR